MTPRKMLGLCLVLSPSGAIIWLLAEYSGWELVAPSLAMSACIIGAVAVGIYLIGEGE